MQMSYSINCLFGMVIFLQSSMHMSFRNWLDHAFDSQSFRVGWPALRLKLPLQSMTALDRCTIRGCSSNLLRGSGLLGRVFSS